MDLIDLIGDSRTDSLPPGFLRSIKIKYRQEASHVFPKERCKDAGEVQDERVKTAASDKSTPSFMGWRVPSRLVTSRPQAPLPKTPASGMRSQGREKLCSRLSGMALEPVRGIASPADTKQQLPRLGSVESARKSPLSKLGQSLPKIQTPVDEAKETLPMSREKVTMSAQGKRLLNKILSEADKGSEKATTNSNIMEVVDKWLATASDKEREVALKFFSTLAGSKAQFLKAPLQKYHTHIEGNCHYCDGDRINDTLESLAKGDKPYSCSKAVHSKEPNLASHSLYQHSRLQLASRVRRSYQTWHHLPIYKYSHGVPNKSSMFTQPHKAIGRHFSIHPEWGLHMGDKHAAF